MRDMKMARFERAKIKIIFIFQSPLILSHATPSGVRWYPSYYHNEVRRWENAKPSNRNYQKK
jgi:hypothetical protein